ncbi:hypothetical protein [Sporolactobacillus pectinivorans]|uniref:hypothetical protein n=1 Tax=Sporolactobacillus pectinivorans TaxID=1591408 RepID=UPI000C260587|nr:hypothetical protein [Sporolactobacillus pectinivorans]
MKRIVPLLGVFLLFVFVSGCGSHAFNAESMDAAGATSSSSKTTGTSHSSSKKMNTLDRSTSAGNTDKDQSAEGHSSGTSNVYISSSTEAINYLRHQLKYDNDNDILFSAMDGSLNTDKRGAYYTIGLVSKSMREQGGSGTLGLYKVYQNGVYVLINPSDDPESHSNSAAGSFHISNGTEAEKYLRHILNDDNNETIVFDDMGGSLSKSNNGYGSFYTIRIIDKSKLDNGKNGMIGIYRVYEAGTCIPQK